MPLSPAAAAASPFDATSLEDLRTRTSAKWRMYPPDVLPAWVAELDVPLAPAVASALASAVARGDTGYPDPKALAPVFAAWSEARWGFAFDPDDTLLVPDVVTGLAELVRAVTEPGDAVLLDPPVYPPFASTVRALGRRVVEAPLVAGAGGRLELDLDAIAAAYAGGAKAHLLCSPHNPAGHVVPRAMLARLAELAAHHGVTVLSDEIHAPLVLEGATHVPFPAVSPAAAEVGLAVVSASKAWNLAGLKAALVVAASPAARAKLRRVPREVAFHAGHLGVVASIAALREGTPWLDDLRALLARNRLRLRERLDEVLPEVGYVPPEASYLAWLDLRPLGLGDDPATVVLERGRLALSSGPTFGTGGAGHARLNLGTTATLLDDAVRRLARAVGRDAPWP